MKRVMKLLVLVLIGVVSIGALVSCKNSNEPDEEKPDYSKLTFAEVFEIEIDSLSIKGGGGMEGLTMAQLTSSSSSTAYQPAHTHHIFNLKAKYDVEITGVSFSMQPEKAANFLCFSVNPFPLKNTKPIFQTGTDPEGEIGCEPISTGEGVLNKTYSFTHSLKRGNQIQFNSILMEEDFRFFINATFYNFKLNFTVVEN